MPGETFEEGEGEGGYKLFVYNVIENTVNKIYIFMLIVLTEKICVWV